MFLQEGDLAYVTVSDGPKLVPISKKAHKSHYIFSFVVSRSEAARLWFGVWTLEL